MGKRYTEEEKHRIQELSEQGHTDQIISQQLGRSINAIRNIRHRNNIKTKETKSIQELKHQTQKLERKRSQLEKKVHSLNQAHQIQSVKLNNKIENELRKLKDIKPELFFITEKEQIGKLTVQLATSFIKWLIE